MSYWTAVNTFFVLGSLMMYFAVTFAMYSNGMFLMLPSAFPFIGEWWELTSFGLVAAVHWIYFKGQVESFSSLSLNRQVSLWTLREVFLHCNHPSCSYWPLESPLKCAFNVSENKCKNVFMWDYHHYHSSLSHRIKSTTSLSKSHMQQHCCSA